MLVSAVVTPVPAVVTPVPAVIMPVSAVIAPVSAVITPISAVMAVAVIAAGRAAGPVGGLEEAFIVVRHLNSPFLFMICREWTRGYRV